MWFYGVMVSTLDSESSDPSSNLGRTLTIFTDAVQEEIVHFNCIFSLSVIQISELRIVDLYYLFHSCLRPFQDHFSLCLANQ